MPVLLVEYNSRMGQLEMHKRAGRSLSSLRRLPQAPEQRQGPAVHCVMATC